MDTSDTVTFQYNHSTGVHLCYICESVKQHNIQSIYYIAYKNNFNPELCQTCINIIKHKNNKKVGFNRKRSSKYISVKNTNLRRKSMTKRKSRSRRKSITKRK